MSLTRIGSIGINTGIAFAGVTTIVTLNTANDALSIGSTVNVGSGITLGASGDIFATGVSTFSGNLKVGSGVTISPDGDGFYTGVVTATTFSGALAASSLTGALPAISGANLTNLDASDLASGTVPTARLGSGTASSSTFLRGDSTFAAVTSTTINSNTNNYLITGTGTADTLQGEANLTFDGLNINQSMSSDGRGLIQTASGNNYIINTINANVTSANYLLGMIQAKWNGTHVADISFNSGSDTSNKDDGKIAFRTSAAAGGIQDRVVIDSSGRLLIGTATTKSAGSGQYAKLNVEGYAGGTECFLSLSRAEAASAMSADDEVANLTFNDSAGYEFARIQVLADAATGATDTPGRLVFKTTADGASSSTERLRIASDGRITQKTGDLIIDQSNNGYGGLRILDSTAGEYSINYIAGRNSGATAHVFSIGGRTQNSSPWANASQSECARISQRGISFNGDSAAANALDDYEEGTFTPNWDAGGGVTFSYSQQHGWYTKIGNTVTFTLYLQAYASTITGGNENNGVALQGLPFAIQNNNRYYPAFTIGRTYKFDINSDQRIYSYGDYGSTNARFIMETDDSTGNLMVANQLNQNTCEMFLSGTYKI